MQCKVTHIYTPVDADMNDHDNNNHNNNWMLNACKITAIIQIACFFP